MSPPSAVPGPLCAPQFPLTPVTGRTNVHRHAVRTSRRPPARTNPVLPPLSQTPKTFHSPMVTQPPIPQIRRSMDFVFHFGMYYLLSNNCGDDYCNARERSCPQVQPVAAIYLAVVSKAHIIVSRPDNVPWHAPWSPVSHLRRYSVVSV